MIIFRFLCDGGIEVFDSAYLCTVLVDMDGVMCDFENHMLSAFRKRYLCEPFVSPVDRRTFYMAEQYDKLK